VERGAISGGTGDVKRSVRVGISACLLGEKVRYDGRDRRDPVIIKDMGCLVEWVPVCPEVGMGLPVPREAMELAGDPGMPGLVEIRTGRDRTSQMLEWSERKVRELEGAGLCGFIFKSRSPSCGMNVEVHPAACLPSGIGRGLFAAIFMKHFPRLLVEEEGRLQNAEARERFLTRVFDFFRGSVRDCKP